MSPGAGDRFSGGFTLIELLLALLLGALLVLLVLRSYLGAKTVQRWHHASSSLDIRGARALGILSRDLRMAGFLAGADVAGDEVPPEAPDCAPGDDWVLWPQGLQVLYAGSVAARNLLPCLPLRQLQPATPLLGIRRVDGAATWGWESGWMPREPRRRQWYLRRDADGRGSMFWSGDRTFAEPVDVESASYWAYRARIYYVRRYSVRRSDAIPTLCVERLMASALRSECLVEGIESLRVEFAVDRDADGVPDSLAVVPEPSMRLTHAQIYVLSRTIQSPGTEVGPQRIGLGGGWVEVAADGHLRRLYQSTVPLMGLAPAAF